MHDARTEHLYVELGLWTPRWTDLVPTDYRADAVVLVVDGEPVFGIILEGSSEWT